MKILINKILPILIIILTLFSVQQWLSISISTTFLSWIIDFTILYIVIKYTYKTRLNRYYYITHYDANLISIYLCWMIFNSIRGIFIADNYWEFKQLINGLLTLSLPLFIFFFSSPKILKFSLSIWFKFILFILIILSPFLSTGAYHYLMGPIFIIGCFIPILPPRWRYFSIGILLIMLVIHLGARSQVIKSAIVLLVATGVCFKRIIPHKLLKITHWTCYIVPIILLSLGITGTFNIFEGLSSNKGKYVEKKVVNGQVVEDDLSADTRTFIYVEVIESALRHNYLIWGRTPARGNDSAYFGAYNAEFLKTGKYERHSNELCHTNIFTWLGLIGVILYSLIYLRSSYLAVYKSNNIYIKFLGCFIAFRWAYGWVEDFNRFDMMNISLWMMIAMGLSIQFRKMDNQQFKLWVNTIFR